MTLTTSSYAVEQYRKAAAATRGIHARMETTNVGRNRGARADQLLPHNPHLFAPFREFNKQPNRGSGKLFRPVSKLG